MKTVDTVLTNQGLLKLPQSLPDPENSGYWSSRIVPMLIRTRTCTGPATPQVGPGFPSTLPVPGKSETWPWCREAFLWTSLCPWPTAAEPCPASYSSQAYLHWVRVAWKWDTGATGPDPVPWEEEMTFPASEAEFDFSLLNSQWIPWDYQEKKPADSSHAASNTPACKSSERWTLLYHNIYNAFVILNPYHL